MNTRFCLLLGLLACSKKPQPEYGSVCRVENYYLAQDMAGKALDIADARRGTRVTGFPLERMDHLTFWRGGTITADWSSYDVMWGKELAYEPGWPTAKIISKVDGGIIGEHPIRVEGSPPKSVTLGYLTPICSAESIPQTCDDETEEKIVFATYRCTVERL